jgi:hypothetical protein
MPAIQARQIRELLEDFKESGRVKNAEEYTKTLTELSTLINADTPEPSFRRILALIWHLCRSVSYNEMMRAIKNDVEAAYFQVDEIGQRLNDHHSFMMKSIISDLEKTIDEQAATIKRLKVLGSSNNEFTHVQTNTFSASSTYSTARNQPSAIDLYCDNRTQTRRSAIELPSAIADIYGKKLILPSSETFRIYPVSVEQISDDNSYGTEIEVEVDNDFSNLIDGERGTFWQRNVYLSYAVEKVSTNLRFNLGKAKNVNYITIEAANTEEVYIESVTGISPDGHRISLLSTPLLVSNRARINFDRAYVRAVEVSFAVYSYEKVDYFVDPKEKLYDIFDPNKILERSEIVDALSPAFQEAVIHDEVIELYNSTTLGSEKVDRYLYRFALDNVWFGDDNYAETAMFVSRPIKIEDVGVLAVKTDEATTSSGINNTIEYDIVKRNTGSNIEEIRTPIPHLNQSLVVHERLVLTRKISKTKAMNDSGALRFCPYVPSDYSVQDDYPVIVYKDGVALTIGTDWKYAISTVVGVISDEYLDWQNTFVQSATFSNYTLTPQRMWILINNPSPKSIYTVSYTIRTSDRTSDDTTVWMDIDKLSFLGEDGRVYFKKDPERSVSSDVYLQVTLRRNTASRRETPELLEYSLLGARYTENE